MNDIMTCLRFTPEADVEKSSYILCSFCFRIWNLSDLDNDGSFNLLEYSIARHFIAMKLEGFDIPHSLPQDFLYLLRSPVSASSPPSSLASPKDTLTATSTATSCGNIAATAQSDEDQDLSPFSTDF